MKITVFNEKYGKIIYDESIWTGRKIITINGTKLKKSYKNTFSYDYNDQHYIVNLKGNIMTGNYIYINGELVRLFPKTKWWEYMLVFLPFIFVIVWSSIPATVEIFPLIGGFMGGAIAGVIAIVSMFLMKMVKKPILKFLIGLGFGLTSILICYIYAIIILIMANAVL